MTLRLSQIIFTGKALIIVHCNNTCISNSKWSTEMTQVCIIHIQMTMWRYKQSYLGRKWPRLLFFVDRCDLDSVYVAQYLSEQNKEDIVKTPLKYYCTKIYIIFLKNAHLYIRLSSKNHSRLHLTLPSNYLE